jgi:hypothetical protein
MMVQRVRWIAWPLLFVLLLVPACGPREGDEEGIAFGAHFVAAVQLERVT